MNILQEMYNDLLQVMDEPNRIDAQIATMQAEVKHNVATTSDTITDDDEESNLGDDTFKGTFNETPQLDNNSFISDNNKESNINNESVYSSISTNDKIDSNSRPITTSMTGVNSEIPKSDKRTISRLFKNGINLNKNSSLEELGMALSVDRNNTIKKMEEMAKTGNLPEGVDLEQCWEHYLKAEQHIKEKMNNIPSGYGNPVSNATVSTTEDIKRYCGESGAMFFLGGILGQLTPSQVSQVLTNSSNRVKETDFECVNEEEPIGRLKTYGTDAICLGDKTVVFEQYSKQLPNDIENELLSKFLERDDSAFGLNCNLNDLISTITNEILKQFSTNKIDSLYVSQNQLIINNVLYAPNIITRYDDFESLLPLGTIEYLQQFWYAYLFDWSYLYNMSSLRILAFDDVNFIYQIVANQLELGTNLGSCTFFEQIPSLQTLYVEKEVLNRNDINNEKSLKVKKKMAKGRRIASLFDGANKNLYNVTGGMSSFFQNTFKDYFVNRGDKKFYRYIPGVIIIGGFTVGSTVLDLGVHGVANIAKNLYNIVGNAIDGKRNDLWFDDYESKNEDNSSVATTSQQSATSAQSHNENNEFNDVGSEYDESDNSDFEDEYNDD